MTAFGAWALSQTLACDGMTAFGAWALAPTLACAGLQQTSGFRKNLTPEPTSIRQRTVFLINTLV
jgi:hypothetical protein